MCSSDLTTATATGLAAGIYSVVVTDANGCTASASVTITTAQIAVTYVQDDSGVTGTFTGTIHYAMDSRDAVSEPPGGGYHADAGPGTFGAGGTVTGGVPDSMDASVWAGVYAPGTSTLVNPGSGSVNPTACMGKQIGRAHV